VRTALNRARNGSLRLILEQAKRAGCGSKRACSPTESGTIRCGRIDACFCDLKDLAVNYGLHF